MKGLLIKDLCNLKQIGRQTLLVLAVMAAWCAFLNNAQIFSMMMALYSMMLMFTAMSYDEMANFDKYALTLPVTRADLVRTKYVLLVLLFGAGMLVGLLGEGIFFLLRGAGELTVLEQTMSLFTVAVFYLLGFLVLIPVIFRLGMEKARLFLSLIFVAMFGLIWAGVMLARSLEIEITEGMVIGAIAAGVLLTAACFFLSYRVSLRIVKRKEW